MRRLKSIPVIWSECFKVAGCIRSWGRALPSPARAVSPTKPLPAPPAAALRARALLRLPGVHCTAERALCNGCTAPTCKPPIITEEYRTPTATRLLSKGYIRCEGGAPAPAGGWRSWAGSTTKRSTTPKRALRLRCPAHALNDRVWCRGMGLGLMWDRAACGVEGGGPASKLGPEALN